MPSNAIVKTGWVRKKREILLLFAAALVLATAVFGLRDSGGKTLSIGSQNFSLEVVATEDERSQGLSGRPALGRNEGMLFVFGKEEVRCIWMKDMNFAIDVLWANNKRQVVHIEHGLSPETYPKNFCSSVPASYVIELPAGSIGRTGIQKGQVLNF